MKKQKPVPAQYRQGDVLIERRGSKPDALKPKVRENGRIVLAHGSATGHAHAIASKCASHFDGDNVGMTHLEVKGGKAAIQHEEHSTITLAPGHYDVIRQREFFPEEVRRVTD